MERAVSWCSAQMAPGAPCVQTVGPHLTQASYARSSASALSININWLSFCMYSYNKNTWSNLNPWMLWLCSENSYSTSMPAKGRFGPVSNLIRIFDTKCKGYEKSLLECPYVEQNKRSCYEDTAVGICCHTGCDGRMSLHELTFLNRKFPTFDII